MAVELTNNHLPSIADSEMARPRQLTEPVTALIVGGYLTVAAMPFVFAATHTWFWAHQSVRAPIAAVLFGLLLVALLFRQRWAWLVLVVFNGLVVVSYAWAWTRPLAFIIDLAGFALLVSSPMREYVRNERLREGFGVRVGVSTRVGTSRAADSDGSAEDSGRRRSRPRRPLPPRGERTRRLASIRQ